MTKPITCGNGVSRRHFLIGSLLLASPLGFQALTLTASASDFVFPARSRGETLLSVAEFGAAGDGVQDDTAAFQAAIDALPDDGGTVVVGPGSYLINPTVKINLRSFMLLDMDPDAILLAMPNAATRAYILYANGKNDIEIAGGQLVGDRDAHTYVTTSTSEWNHGIQVLGCTGVTLRDLHVGKCAGDGICIGGNTGDLLIANVVSTGNRRQGLSLTRCHDVKVYDSEFSYTQGTNPQCGIDIEPDYPYLATNIWIENCRLANNGKYGVNVYKRASNVTLTNCIIDANGSCGAVTAGCSAVSFAGNLVRYNASTGIYFSDASANCAVSGDLSYGNSARLGIQVRKPFTLTGWSSRIQRDILIKSTATGTQVLTNNYQ